MEGATESPFNSQADNEIETYEDSDAEMEIEEDPEEIELKIPTSPMKCMYDKKTTLS